MSGAEVLDVARDAILTLVLVASPLMLIGLVVGVVISLFQALTQIQEMTLVFVPKILAIFVAMLVALPFMADLLQGHMARLARASLGGMATGYAGREAPSRAGIQSVHPEPPAAFRMKTRSIRMKIDISFLPAYAAAFMLVFARIGTMIMLLPGLGEMSVPRRVRLSVALVLAAVLLPLHRSAYQLDLRSFGPVIAMLGQEIFIGAVLGITARLMISALQVAGFVIAQQLGLGFVTAVDPTQGQQGVLVGNFLTILGVTMIFAADLHHLVIAALNDSYALFRPGEIPLLGDVAALTTQTVATAVQDRHPACGAVPRVRAAVQSRPRRAVAADAADAGVLCRPAAVDPARLPDPAARRRRDHDRVPRLGRNHPAPARAVFVRRHGRDPGRARQIRRPDAEASRRCAPSAAMSPRARRSTPGSSLPAARWC